MQLGEDLSCALAICHIFTGNDFNPAFYRRGKVKPFKTLKKNDQYINGFLQLLKISDQDLTTGSEKFSTIEKFVCQMYGLKETDVNKGRYEVFEKLYKSKKDSEKVLKKTLTGCDPSSFPPTKQELLQQIKRTTYISNVWCNAHLRSPTDKKPEDYGWTIIDNKYVFYWFEGPESPSFEAIRGITFLFFLRKLFNIN